MIKISVLMPVYNCENYVSDAIESILNQTYTNFEFIIINDGSHDSTSEIINKYAKVDSRIKIINHSENKGLIYSLNEGIDIAKGEYIARMDADDISLTDRFQKQIAYLDENKDVGLLGGAGQNFGENNKINYSPKYVDIIELLKDVSFYHPSVMIRKSILDKYNIKYNSNYYLVEDYELWTQLLKYTKLRNLSDVLIKYRVHKDSESNRNKNLQEYNKMMIRKILLERISYNSYYQKEIFNLVNNHNLVNKELKLFNIIPILKLKSCIQNKTIISLFNIPIIKIKNDKLYLFCFIKIGEFSKFNKNLKFKKFYNYNIDNHKILNILREIGHFVFIPNSGNLGDMVIAKASLDFFNKNKLNYTMYKTNIKNPECIVYGGGGAWINEYYSSWKKWLPLFKTAKQVVILPSSFNSCPDLVNILDERFTIFCREEQSYKYLKKQNTKATIILDHDMAFRLENKSVNGKLKVNNIDEYIALQRFLYCIPSPKTVIKYLRSDIESVNKDVKTDIDISALCYGDEYSSTQYIEFCTRLFFAAIDTGDVIITDRLHVAIVASLLNKKVIMLDNSYNKLSNVYKHTMFENNNVTFQNKIPKFKVEKSKKMHQNHEILKLALKS